MSKGILPYHTVDSQGSTKEKIITTTITLCAKKNYHQTSLDEIAEACDIRKASIFHHFNTKLDLIIDVIKTIQNDCQAFIFDPVMNATENRANLIVLFKKLTCDYIQKRKDINIPACITFADSQDSPKLKQTIKTFYDIWIQQASNCFDKIQTKKDSSELSKHLITLLTGHAFLQQASIKFKPTFLDTFFDNL